jgi:ribonuclease HII
MEIKLKEMKSGEVKDVVMSILKEDKLDYDFKELSRILKKDERKTLQSLSEVVNRFIDSREKEISRVKTMYDFDKDFKNYVYIAGVDEVGRGPLAGPIVAASVILDLNYKSDKDLILGIKDSKKLTEKTREKLDVIIKEKALSYNIFEISNDEIDTKGIAWCNNEVLKKAVTGLSVEPSLALSDGYAIKNCPIENDFVIKGDVKSASIACASIIAKVYRDNLMKEYNSIYPHYGFDKNSGYGTKEHIEAIKKYGYSKIHRTSFLKNIHL